MRTRVYKDTCIDRSIPLLLLLSTTPCRHAGERCGHHRMAGHINKIPSLCSPLSSHIAILSSTEDTDTGVFAVLLTRFGV